MHEPTDAQKKAGNYSKDHQYILGMRVSIENPAGSTRKGTAPDGTPWESGMAHDYGYIRGTTGRDRDHLDVFLGPDHKNADKPIVVVDQHDPETGDFDEHKVLMGFEDEGDAMDAYHQNYPDDWGGLGGVRSMPLKEFKKWAFGEGRRVKPAMKLKRGGLVQNYAAGGSVQHAKDFSLSQLSPFGVGLDTIAPLVNSGIDLARNKSGPAITGAHDFSNERIGDDVLDAFANPSRFMQPGGDAPNMLAQTFTGADGYTYRPISQGNSSGSISEGNFEQAPVTNYRQLGGKSTTENTPEWLKAGYDKIYNLDGTFSDVAGNREHKLAPFAQDFAQFAITAASLASGNPALAFAKTIGSKVAMDALKTAMGPNQKPHMFGGTNKYLDSFAQNRATYAHGGRVGALSLMKDLPWK